MRRSGPGIPEASEHLTADWLRAALAAGGRSDHPRVRHLTREPIGEGVGLMAEILRCELTPVREPGAPASVIVKIPSARRRNRRLGRLFGLYRRECRFYRHLASEAPIRAPALYYGDFDARSHRFVLVLEDLRNLATADQIAGASPAQAKQAVRAAARLHGTYWNRVERLARAGFDETLAARVWVGLQVVYLLNLPRALRLLADSWSAEVQDLAEEYGLRLVDHFDHLVRGPLTFVHGDYRLDNMFFGGDDENGFAVVDWQNSGIASGLYDVAYFLAGSVTPEVRRLVEKDALLEYHDILCRLGARDFSFADCWGLYRETLLGCLVLPVVAAAGLEEVPGRQLLLRDTIARRTAAAVRDRDARAFLPRLPPRPGWARLRSACWRSGYRMYRALR